jgi:hypothetical protein
MKKLLLVATVLLLGSCSAPKEYATQVNSPDHLHRAIKGITDMIVHDIFSPPVASRIYAYVSVAAYEAARHQDSSLLTLAGQLHGLTPVPEPEPNVDYCFPLAAVQAVLQTGRSFIFSERDLDAFSARLLNEYHDSGLPEDVYRRSVEYGTAIANHIVKWSSGDNYKQSRSFPKYSIDNSESTWKPTPPAYMDAVEPHWNKIRTFVIDSASEFRSPPVPQFSKVKGSPFYQYALEVYNAGKNLTKEQDEIARFWDCNPFVMNVKGHVMFATKKISPGGHWMNITHVACVKAHADFAHAAEAYVRVALSIADAFIDCWDEKYRSLLIRPETYIGLYIDEDWVPLLQTPPFPEYVSGHSMISAAAASALTGVFGDNFAFTDSTETEFGLSTRKFTSFSQAANEAARSRLFGGIHYRPANESGAQMGANLGAFIVRKLRTRKNNATRTP